MSGNSPVNSKRRGFLLAAGAGGAVAAGAVATLTPQAQVAERTVVTPKKVAGYQESAHIRDYYDTARV